ncbi:alpha/beta hydrolase [candidate division KSB1 bacterium]
MSDDTLLNTFSHLIEPFSFDSGEAACLLLHGFTGSPSEMRPLGEFLASHGYAARCPLLPGHGTSIDDLERYGWRDWYQTAEEEWNQLQTQHKKVFIIGLSMGGALALQLAAGHRVDGVVTLASGVKFTDWRIRALPFLRLFIRKVRKTKNAYARGPDRIRFAYDYNSSKATGEIVNFYRNLKSDLGKIKSPLLLINARGDRTMPIINTDIISKRVRSSQKKIVVLDSDDHIVTLGEYQDTVHKEILGFLSSLT